MSIRRLATNAMAQVAVKNGAAIQRYNPVQAIRRESGTWIVETAKGTLRAQHIVNAAGTWGFEVGPHDGRQRAFRSGAASVSRHRHGARHCRTQ